MHSSYMSPAGQGMFRNICDGDNAQLLRKFYTDDFNEEPVAYNETTAFPAEPHSRTSEKVIIQDIHDFVGMSQACEVGP